MKEYKVITVYHESTPQTGPESNCQKSLNRWAKEGWQFMQYVQTRGDLPFIILEREKGWDQS